MPYTNEITSNSVQVVTLCQSEWPDSRLLPVKSVAQQTNSSDCGLFINSLLHLFIHAFIASSIHSLLLPLLYPFIALFNSATNQTCDKQNQQPDLRK